MTADVDDDRQDEVGRGIETEAGEAASFVAHELSARWVLDVLRDPALPHGRRIDERVMDRDVIDDNRMPERCLVEIPASRRLPVGELGPVEADGPDQAARRRDLRHLADHAREVCPRGYGGKADID